MKRYISLSIGKRGIQDGAVFLQFGIGWGAQASQSARPDQTRRARGLGSILADRPALPMPTRPRRIPSARMQDQDKRRTHPLGKDA